MKGSSVKMMELAAITETTVTMATTVAMTTMAPRILEMPRGHSAMTLTLEWASVLGTAWTEVISTLVRLMVTMMMTVLRLMEWPKLRVSMTSF